MVDSENKIISVLIVGDMFDLTSILELKHRYKFYANSTNVEVHKVSGSL